MSSECDAYSFPLESHLAWIESARSSEPAAWVGSFLQFVRVSYSEGGCWAGPMDADGLCWRERAWVWVPTLVSTCHACIWIIQLCLLSLDHSVSELLNVIMDVRESVVVGITRASYTFISYFFDGLRSFMLSVLLLWHCPPGPNGKLWMDERHRHIGDQLIGVTKLEQDEDAHCFVGVRCAHTGFHKLASFSSTRCISSS